MLKLSCLLEALIVIMVGVVQQATSTPIVCYYKWHGPQDLTPDRIETGFCSHIIAGFASLTDTGRVDPGNMTHVFKQVADIKNRQPGLKVMLSVRESSRIPRFTNAVKTPEARNGLIESILELLKECGMDGVDVDWEFPGWDSPYSDSVWDKQNFALFLQDFRKAVAGTSTLLSIAVAMSRQIILASYDVKAIAMHVDFINLMSYGLHEYNKFIDPYTGVNSPLRQMAWAANYWATKGMPKEKIMVGIPTYGHTYVLANASVTLLDSKAVGGGQNWTYSQVCDFLKTGAQVVFDQKEKAPYAFKGLDWVSYENEESIREKAEWIKSNKYGGAMTFNLNFDDWKKSCGEETFPLHKMIYSVFSPSAVRSKTAAISSTFISYFSLLMVYCLVFM